ncbi:phosphorelay sensor kinase [Aureococcus anophagefferens]|nr:phosphorelay sensor kinase [Aureococcus anophagefferens]
MGEDAEKPKKSKPKMTMRLSSANMLKLPGNKKIKMPFVIKNPLKDKLPIFLPDDPRKNYWDALMFMVIFYNCNMTPIAIATQPRKSNIMSQLRLVDFAFDVLFVFDTLAGFMFAFKDPDTKEIVKDQKAIGDMYMSSARLKLNLLAISPLVTLPNPFSNFLLGSGVCKSVFSGHEDKVVRVSRKMCLKAARLTRSSRIFLFFAQLNAVRVILEDKKIMIMNEATFRMTQIIVSLIFMCSFCGSFYFFLACNDNRPKRSPYCTYGNMTKPTGTWDYDDDDGGGWSSGERARREKHLDGAKTWVGADAVFQEHRSWDAVVARMMYFCVQTLFTIGYGDSVAPVSKDEIQFSLFLMLTGALTYALVIANMTSVLANANVLYCRHTDETNTMASLMDDRDLPDGLKGRVKLSFEYMWSKQWGMLDRHLLGEMPVKLREMVLESQIALVKQVPFFAPEVRKGNDDLAKAAALAMATRVYIPQSTIVYAHEKQREMFIVRVGPILVYSMQSPTAIASLAEGDLFGDFQLVLDVKHPVAMKTGMSFAELFTLAYKDYAAIKKALEIKVEESDPAVVAMTEAYQARLKQWQTKNTNMAASADADDVAGAADVRELAAQNVREAQSKRLLILPYAKFHLFWEPGLFVAVFFTFLMIPMRAMLYTNEWKRGTDRRGAGRGLDALGRGIVAGEEVLITDQRKIMSHYVKSFRFKVDVVANFPYVILAPILMSITDSSGGDDSGFNLGPMWFAALRFPHLLRGLNFGVYLKEIRDYLDIGEGVVIKDKTITILQRTYETIFLIIFMACFWSIIHGHGTGDEGQSFNSAFLRSFYFAIVTFTTVGYGDITPSTISETWFMVVSGAVGATFFAGIVANITSFVHSVDISEDNISHKRTVMTTFMEERALAEETQHMVNSYFDYMENEKGGLDDLKLLNKFLAENMKDDVTLYLTHRVILSFKIFRGTEAGFLRSVMLVLVQHFYMRDEQVVVQGEPADGTSFIAAGDVDIILDGEVVKSLTTNEAFAEAAILSVVDAFPYTASCTSYNEQWFLSRTAFVRLLPEFLVVRAKLTDMAKRVRTYKVKNGNRATRQTTSADGDGKGSAVCFMDGFGIEKSVVVILFIDYVGDIVFLADIVLQARYVAFLEGDQVIHSRKKIFNRVQFLSVFRVNKMIRFGDVVDLVKRCEASCNAVGLKLHKNSVRMARLIFAILISSHFFGSIFFAIANTRGKANACARYRRRGPRGDKYCGNWAMERGGIWPPNLLNVEFYEGVGFPDVLGVANTTATFSAWGTKKPKWDVNYSLGSDKYLWKQYVNSFYWGSATITTVGYGDISPTSLAEIIFAIFCLIMSVIIYTLIVANLEDIVANLDVTNTLNNIKREKVKQYCLRSYLPEKVQSSIFDYYDKLWAQQKGVSGTELLKMLPENLRAHVVQELAGNMLTLDLYMPMDFLFHSGECAWQIFFIFFGSAQLLDEGTKQVYSSLERAALGESEFFSRVLYPVSAQATDYSQIFVLHYDNLVKVMRDNDLLAEFKQHCIDNEAEIKEGSLDKIKDVMAVNLKHEKIIKSYTQMGVGNELDKSINRLIDPGSLFKRLWLLKQTFFMDVMLMCFYCVDVYLNMTVFMVKKQGKVISDREHFRALYIQQYFFNDVVGLAPLSLLSVLTQNTSFQDKFIKANYEPVINALRLFQVLRVKQANLYVASLLTFLEDFGVNLNGDMIYLIMLIVVVLVMCHWLACLFYAIGRWELWYARADSPGGYWSTSSSDYGENTREAFKWYKDDAYGCEEYLAMKNGRNNIWMCDGGMYAAGARDRWLMAFYWAMYTCSTIGYGALSIKSNAEKLLSCLAMILGAVVCDAGVTAVLTAFIEHMDHQAGTNKRRMDCATRMMTASNVDPALQKRVCDFFDYVDQELYNLDAQEILDELNIALRNDILHRAAHLKLCDSLMYGGFEAGIVATMVYQMKTIVAVPQEKVLEIGQPDPSLYIFQSGVAHSLDGCGDEEYIAVGMILSNIEFKQVAKRVGVPTKQLVIKIVACRGLPTQNGASARLLGASPCDPYVEAVVISKTVFGQSVKTCATKVRKFTCDPEYKETFTLKAYQNTETALVSAIHWRRGLAGKKLGTAEIAVKEKYKRPMWHKLLNDAGKKVGDVKVKCEFNALERSGIASTAELTVVADSFCHLYFLDFRSQDIVKKYIKGMRLNLTKRLEGLSGGGAADWRPEETALDAMTNGDDEMSLCSNHQNSRGFEAYMSEAFSKRSTKGSVMQVSDNRRRSSLGGKQGGGGGGRDKKGPRGTVSHADDKGKVVPVK